MGWHAETQTRDSVGTLADAPPQAPAAPPPLRFLTPLRVALAGYLIVFLTATAVLLRFRIPEVGFSGADESAHFLNGYFIADYLRHQFLQNPLAAAQEFYLHYPKLSIGHWPPFHYGLLALAFLVLPADPATSLWVNTVLSATPALVIALAVHRIAGPLAALAACLVYGLLPLVIQSQMFLMLDLPLAGWLSLAALLWAACCVRGGWAFAFLFAGASVAAILTKGNGWLIGLFVVFHIVLTARWKLLGDIRLYVAAAAGCLILVPWYWITTKIAADGFNYEPGLDYALLALGVNTRALLNNVGVIGLALALTGLAAAWQRRKAEGETWLIASICASLVFAALALQSLVPVDIDPRYMIPALPPLVVLAFLGIARVHAWIAQRGAAAGARLAAVVLTCALLVPGLQVLLREVPKIDFRLAETAALLKASSPGGVWVIDGPSGAEGAMIVETAIRDPERKRYVVRSSKILAESDFMANEYRLTATGPADAIARLHRLGASGVVLVRRERGERFPHSELLAEALGSADSGYTLIAELPHRHRPGVTRVFAATQPVEANPGMVRSANGAAKAAAITRAVE